MLESSALHRLNLSAGHYVFATLHRTEYTHDPKRFTSILGGLKTVSKTLQVTLSLHPRAWNLVGVDCFVWLHKLVLFVFHLVGYWDIVTLEMNARAKATDSVELVETCWIRRAPARDTDDITAIILASCDKHRRAVPRYGNAHAAEKITAVLLIRVRCVIQLSCENMFVANARKHV